ncbi:hypothetical protein DCAR_0414837 [Daucus carota subsp. sativus]|uniref:Replication protein A 70 kDa DNA-binding subunit B/D first OB fold domain-containing protein n=1 Tax=Daucus carota subsp. sativus TaxID=79200 RepID=A0A165A1T8_DAUCS|nr:hypothetical protein DCAR_0414837 [Daucus carota subsp. sativus]
MDASITTLKELSSQSDCYNIRVKVTRIWESVNKHNGATMHTNILPLDQQGNNIVAIIRNNQKNQFLQMLEENVVYTISNLKVVQGPKLCRTADVNYVLNFFYRMKINKEVDTRVIPLYSFELQDYEAVAELVENVKVFIELWPAGTPVEWSPKMDIVLNNISTRPI